MKKKNGEIKNIICVCDWALLIIILLYSAFAHLVLVCAHASLSLSLSFINNMYYYVVAGLDSNSNSIFILIPWAPFVRLRNEF